MGPGGNKALDDGVGTDVNLGIFFFILSIIVVIMVHETGHFVVAKLFNFKATRFFLGFGPTVWSTQKGETEYGVKAIPAGGFVKIVGMNPYEEVDPADEPRSYPNKPRWQRALLLVAGSATHWVIAFLLLVFAAMAIGFPGNRATNEISIVETEVAGQETPAAEIDLQPGERIIAIGGRPTDSWSEIRNYIRAHGGQSATFTLEDREEDVRTVSVTLGRVVFNARGEPIDYAPPGEHLDLRPGQDAFGFLGVQPAPELEKEDLLGAIGISAEITWDTTKLAFRGIGDVFSMVYNGELWDALTGTGQREIGEGPLSLVGATRIAGETVERGRFLDLIGLIVGFAIFVGLMNLLPLPPLDGGHLIVLAYEKVTGRVVDVRKLIPIAAAVISFFALLFIAVLYLDLARPIHVPF